MADIIPRPAYDTSSASSLGEAPSAKENGEWIEKKFQINRDILVSAEQPNQQTVKAGTARVFRDAVTGRVTIYANSGGQIIDLLSFEV